MVKPQRLNGGNSQKWSFIYEMDKLWTEDDGVGCVFVQQPGGLE